MKRFLSAALMAAMLLGLFISSPAFTGEAQAASSGEKITVLTPLGTPPNITLKKMAPRLDTLDGKTIYVVDNIYPGSDRLLTEMAAWFEREMPKTKAIYKRKNAPGGFEGEDPELWAEIKEKADAVIIGLGH
jgi:hypothetical protein